MATVKRYTSYFLVAALAATAGWGASVVASHQASNAIPATATVPAQLDAIPAAAPASDLNQSGQLLATSAGVAVAAKSLTAQPVTSQASAPTVRTSATRARAVNPRAEEGVAPEVARSESRGVPAASAPPYERKSGMSNKTKTAIAIGGGAATGAIIGGIAGGGKGAAIGAILGGGGGAVYSVIRHKQHKPVW